MLRNIPEQRRSYRLKVFENMVRRKILWRKRDEVTGEWRRLHNEELNDLYSSSNIIRVTKWRRMRWAGHVARVGDRRGAYRVLVGDLRERGNLGDLGVDGRITLKWIFKK
jgi:hypothetical protein